MLRHIYCEEITHILHSTVCIMAKSIQEIKIIIITIVLLGENFSFMTSLSS